MSYKNCDVFDDILTYPDNYFNLIFSDPPYQLGSKYEIGSDGQFKIKGKSKDFMNKWEGILPKQWDIFFKEANRICKYGAYVVMFGMEENGMLLQYYAIKHNFEICQSLAWYNTQGFPKSLNINKQIDKKSVKEINTASLISKYKGYHAGKKPLKPCLETIYVFRKPLMKESLIEDILEYETGNNNISPCCLNIEKGRVDLRYPSQLFVDSDSSFLLDTQSGIVSSGNKEGGYSYKGSEYDVEGFVKSCKPTALSNYGDSGGCSKILHKCDYENNEIKELIYFNSKASKKEKEAGLESFSNNTKKATTGKGLSNCNPRCPVHDAIIPSGSNTYACGCKFTFLANDKVKNNHPSVKPISLIRRLFDLFLLPIDTYKVYIPFSGVGSEIIGAIKAGVKEENIFSCEISKDFFDISVSRIDFYSGREIEKGLLDFFENDN